MIARMQARLADLSVLAVDCQSTGATPAHGALLELGWALDDGAARASLVQLPAGTEISRQVRRITGIVPEDMREARSRPAVWDALEDAIAALPRPVPTVIHFATFEERWLRDLHGEQRPGEPFPFAPICTHKIARRLLPLIAPPRRQEIAQACALAPGQGREARGDLGEPHVDAR